jgi:sporulation protein YlmC with PRC-barrel domain
MNTRFLISTLAFAASLALGSAASAQVAGSTVLGASVSEGSQVATGWSAKRSILGKTIYNDTGAKVGKVEDLIIDPERNVSFVIVGAGGFVGIGRHDVAVPVGQVKSVDGKLVMAGATKDTIKSMPQFEYASATSGRAQFVKQAEDDIAKGKTKVAELEKKSSAAMADAKVGLTRQADALKVEVKATEVKLGEMKTASAARWKEFEASVSAATARLRKSLDMSTG